MISIIRRLVWSCC